MGLLNLTAISAGNNITSKRKICALFTYFRECSANKSALLSQLHSGDLCSLVGLVNLQKLDLGDCDKITGELFFPYTSVRTSPGARFRDCSVNTSDFFYNSAQATLARSWA